MKTGTTMRLEKALSKEKAIAISGNKNIGSIDFARYDSWKPDVETLVNLNHHVLKKRSDICIRVFDCTDISFLEYLPDLSMLQWEANDLSNYGTLVKIKKLQWLRISNENSGPAISLSWLKQFSKSLEILMVSGLFTEITTISTLTNLRQLFLGSLTLKDCLFLAALPNLKKLTLSHTKIKDVAAINKLQLLEFGNIGSQLKDFNFLIEQKQLKYLSITLSTIEQLDFIVHLKELRILQLSWLTKIVSLPALYQLQHLEKVSVDLCNKLTDITALKKLKGCSIEVYDCKLVANCSVAV